jgi:uncharacterized protein (TIGR00304 family)
LALEDSLEMRPLSLISISILVAGTSLVVFSVASREADVSLVVVFPVVSGSGILFLAGVALVVVGMLLGFLLLATAQNRLIPGTEDAARSGRSVEERSKYGGVVLIGPVPIVFGSDTRIAYLMLAVAAVTLILIVGLALLALR